MTGRLSLEEQFSVPDDDACVYVRGGFLGAVSVGGSAEGLSELRSLRLPSSLAAFCSALLAVLVALDTLESLYEPLTSPSSSSTHTHMLCILGIPEQVGVGINGIPECVWAG